MQRQLLRLVTILHPTDLITAAGLGDLRALPYLTKSRVQRSATQALLAQQRNLRGIKRYVPKGIITDYGTHDPANQGSNFLRGGPIVPHLAEPRLIHMPDNKPRFRWKFEFRKSWNHDPQGELSAGQKAALLSTIERTSFLIKAAWSNDPLTPDSTDGAGVNLVLVPVTNTVDLHEVHPHFGRGNNATWIEL